jgi:hypothetical protein
MEAFQEAGFMEDLEQQGFQEKMGLILSGIMISVILASKHNLQRME